MLGDSALRATMVAAGHARVAQFSWQRSVRAIHSGYMKVLGRAGRRASRGRASALTPPPSGPRIALVHDWLTGMRGGEKVLLSLARLFPDAPIFTLLHVRGSLAPELEARDIRTTFVQHLPAVETHYRRYLPLFPAAAASIDLAGFDLVISSSHCVAKGVRVPRGGAARLLLPHPDALRVGPLRRLLRTGGRVSGLTARRGARGRGGSARLGRGHRRRGVHRYAANSAYVAGRIRRYYGRGAAVIPPPVDTDFFTPDGRPEGGYDLVVSALVPYKRIELVLDAYRGRAAPPEGRRRRVRRTARLRALAGRQTRVPGPRRRRRPCATSTAAAGR